MIKPKRVEKGDEKDFRDIYDILKNIGKVHSRIKQEITSDFIFAKLPQNEKDFVIEMVVNAFDTLRVYTKAKFNIIDMFGPDEWNRIENQFNKYQEDTFDTFMNRVFMIVNMNRNIDDNFMINIMSQIQKAKEETQKIENAADASKRLKEMVKENN